MDDVLTTSCVNHPGTETGVRCSRCDAPICPKCMISTPVGMRCRECADLKGSPIYDVSGRYLWQALAVAAGIVVAGGYLWSLIQPFIARTFLLSFFIYAFAGIGAAELLSRAANHKRGLRLQVMAVVAVALAMLAKPLLLFAITHRFAVNPLTLLLVLVGCVGAWNKLR